MQQRHENHRTHGSSKPSTEHAINRSEIAEQPANEVARNRSKSQTEGRKDC